MIFPFAKAWAGDAFAEVPNLGSGGLLSRVLAAVIPSPKPAGRVTITFRDLGDGRTEMTNHYAGWTSDAMEPFMRQGTNEQYDKLGVFLTR